MIVVAAVMFLELGRVLSTKAGHVRLEVEREGSEGKMAKRMRTGVVAAIHHSADWETERHLQLVARGTTASEFIMSTNLIVHRGERKHTRA